MEEQQVMLDDTVYGLLLGNEKKYIDEWFKGKSVKRKLQEKDFEIR